jgi:hypothetical protein
MKPTALLFLAALTCAAAPIGFLTGIQSVTFFEQSGSSGSFTYTLPFFTVSDLRIYNRLPTLDAISQDFSGLSNENYDAFLSDANGNPNALGEFISIEGSFNSATSSGLNIDWVRLNFSGGGIEYANWVPSFVSAVAYVSGSELRILGAPDGLITQMGRTTGTDRMRVTVGFLSSSGVPPGVPEPSTYLLTGAGLMGIGFLHRKRRRTARASEAAL